MNELTSSRIIFFALCWYFQVAIGAMTHAAEVADRILANSGLNIHSSVRQITEAVIPQLPQPAAGFNASGQCTRSRIPFESQAAKDQSRWNSPAYDTQFIYWGLYHYGTRAGNFRSTPCADGAFVARAWQAALGETLTGSLTLSQSRRFVEIVNAGNLQLTQGKSQEPTVVAKPSSSQETSLSQEERLRASCDKANLIACNDLGFRLLGGDNQRAVLLFERACDGGNADGCLRAGTILNSDRWVVPDPVRAARAYEKGCELAPNQTCSMLANMYNEGRGGAKNPRRAADLFKKACDNDNWFGCIGLGTMHLEGKDLPVDYLFATSLFEKACEGGEVNGCISWGTMLYEGRGVAKDEARAVFLFQKACRNSGTYACEPLARAFREGKGVAQD